MNKRTLLAASIVGALTLGTAAAIVIANNGTLKLLTRATGSQLVLDKNAELVSEDQGYYHSLTIRNNEFDFLGWSSATNKLGNIKKKNYNNVFDYNGMVYNRTAINGFTSLTVKFSGANLYYTLTDYLMEDMNFNKSNQVTSNTAINVLNNEAYFILYTDDTNTGVDIESITVDYKCDGSIDSQMIFNENSTLGGARSMPKETVLTSSFLLEENNPTYYHNYSSGSYNGHDKTWYRWNGRRFDNSANLGGNFELHTTILGNISQAVNHYSDAWNNYFNYSVWPEYWIIDGETTYKDWDYTYIGNDNYEPLGKDDPNRINTDTYGDYSYAGRFITTYTDIGGGTWEFTDPDNNYIPNSSTVTYRDLYERYNLPYWHLCFKITSDTTTRLVRSQVYVNNVLVSDSPDFYDKYDGDEIVKINTYHMHCVNYGQAKDVAANSYKGVFTYPRIVNL